MAKLSDLVLRISEVTGVPVATVREVSRRLREANLIQTGKGGRYGGAEMTPGDAATLLTGLLIVRASSVPLSEIVSVTKAHLTTFRAYCPRGEQLLLGQWNQKLGLPELCKLKRGHSFGDSFSALVASMSNGDFKRAVRNWASKRPRGEGPFFSVELSINSPRPHPEARLEFHTPAFGRLYLLYLRPADAQKLIETYPPRKWTDVPPHAEFDLTVRASVSEQSLSPIGLLLGEGEPVGGTSDD
jgi:hypothetical protein